MKTIYVLYDVNANMAYDVRLLTSEEARYAPERCVWLTLDEFKARRQRVLVRLAGDGWSMRQSVAFNDVETAVETAERVGGTVVEMVVF